MKESCHSKVRIFASASQALLALLDTYAAAVIAELLMHLSVTAQDSGREHHRGKKCWIQQFPLGSSCSLICSQAVML